MKNNNSSRKVTITFSIPEKAKYIAQDQNGYFRYYALKPKSGVYSWIPNPNDSLHKELHDTIFASGKKNLSWKKTLQRIK